ncbi:MAG TPA: prepilin-type N-terminal cleavage/methylation domain-containing protein [Vicinamibacterales bacterium]|nr:prepilin-type N-terminal cleavage/methylation domain-containing protein [Vicinamibacterales bacterium]
MNMTSLKNERGFTLMELMIASVVTTIVLGTAVALTSQIQNGYRRQLEDSAAEQEARYALEWVSRYLRGAGTNSMGATTSTCVATNTAFEGVIMYPADDSRITLQMDSNPPDKAVGGISPDCTQANEQVTISFCSEAAFLAETCTAPNTIQFLDDVVGDDAATRTDNVIDDLQFTFFGDDGATAAVNNASIRYVTVSITVRTRTINAASGNPDTRTLSTTVRVRDR